MRCFAFIIIALSALLGGCATNPFHTQEGTASGYKTAQQPQPVTKATVIGIRDVKLIGQHSVLGERIGASLGGLLGFALAQEATKKSAIQAVMGTMSGAIGMQLGKQAAGTVTGQELLIRTETGQVFSVAQSSADGVRFKPDQKVLVIGSGRIVPVGD